MPIVYEFDEARNFATVKASGELTDEDVLRFEMAIINEPRRRPGTRVLVDATDVKSTTLTRQALETIVDLEKERLPKPRTSKTAVVIRDAAGWQRAQELAGMVERTMAVFDNMDVAMAWLGYSDETKDS